MATVVQTYHIQWTAPVGDLAQANGIADDEAAVVNFANCISYYAEWDTIGATTGASNFDFHLISSADGVNYINTASHTTLAGVVAINVRDGDTKVGADIPIGNVMFELDVNAVDVTAAEYVILRLVLLNQYD